MTTDRITIHQKTFSIVWGDMDALGHVNNTRYFDYFQEARIEWLISQQITMREQEGPVLVQIGCTFLKPVIYPATLTMISYMHSPGRSSVIVEHDLLQDNQLMAQGTSKVVWVNYSENKSIPLPDAIRRLFS